MNKNEVIQRLTEAGEWISTVAQSPVDEHVEQMLGGIDEAVIMIETQKPAHTEDLRPILDEKLKTVAHFVFKKKSGEMREAFGTLSASLIPKYTSSQITDLVETSANLLGNFGKVLQNPTVLEQDPDPIKNSMEWVQTALIPFEPKQKKLAREKPPTLITYFDLVSNGWRSFHEENLVTVH